MKPCELISNLKFMQAKDKLLTIIPFVDNLPEITLLCYPGIIYIKKKK